MDALRRDADDIVRCSIERVLPDAAVKRALSGRSFGSGRLILVAIGKAGWQMARAAKETLGARVSCGAVVTKYAHAKGALDALTIYEAGHPVPDENSFRATRAVLALTQDLTANDTVLLLLSGGGSALFEAPAVEPDELQDVTRQLLACGADISEINTIRKRFSLVKGGRFAAHCAPAKVFTVILSDVLDDRADTVASGPACPDETTCEEALAIARKYDLKLSPAAWARLHEETPKALDNAENVICGSVRELCRAAADRARALGYEPILLTNALSCEAREAGRFLAAIAKTAQDRTRSVAFIAGGETVVHITGSGLGGRNQELALAAARGVAGLSETAVFSFGSDGTDGPTDAAGGYVSGRTDALLRQIGVDAEEAIRNSDAYHALERIGGLIMTGPTGTNVNDVSLVLVRR